LELIVDGIIYLYQKYGGISQLYTEILPRLCELDPELTITLLIHPYGSPDCLPQLERIIHQSIPDVYRFFRPHRFWNHYYSQLCQLAVRAFLGKSKGRIWMSTYYTVPIAWAGSQVFVAYDFIYEKYRTKYWQNELSSADETIRNKKNAISKADLVICISETTRQDLMELYHVPIHKTAVVHLAHKSSFTLMDGISNEQKDKFILYVGNRYKYKDFDLLLRSYANWSGRFEIPLICAGGGEWTDLEEQSIIHYGLDKRVSLFPQVDDLNLCKLYNQASLFIFPSQYEGFGIPLLEAMACGCPVIASRIPSSIEIAGDIPIYFAPGNMDELMGALDQAISEGRITPRTIEGLELVRQYSWEITAQGFLKAIRSVV
jgi:glycosyltransferase involved in cell wall biosynthesis